MTMQRSDYLWHEGEKYTILGGLPYFGFDPSDWGLRTFGRNTANYRGFWCEYAISDGRLELRNLFANAVRYPAVNGVEAKAPQVEPMEVHYLENGEFVSRIEDAEANDGYHAYRDVGLPLGFSGTVLIGRDQAALTFSHVGYLPAWTFSVVLELSLKDGVLTGVSDKSASLAEERAQAIREELDLG